MQLYRVCRQKYAELSGYGAQIAGGRWNRKGIPALYAAGNASLAVLEVLVHLDRSELPEDYVLLSIHVPEERIVHKDPALASDAVDLERFRTTGYATLPKEMVGFSVPSAIVPQDRVVVLYPETAAYRSTVRIGEMSPFGFDRRLFFTQPGPVNG